MGRHRQCPKRAPIDLKKSPLITRYSRCSLDLHRTRLYSINIITLCFPSMFLDKKKAQTWHQKSPRITRFSRGALIFQKSMTRYKTNSQINITSWCSWTQRKPKDGPEISPKEPLDHKTFSMFWDSANG